MSGRSWYVVVAVSMVLSSCMKEELPIPAPEPADAQAGSICMTPTYQDQVFFDLGTNSVISSNQKEDWDVAFATGSNDAYVVLNAARLMRAAVSPYQQLDQVTDTLSVSGQFNIDVSSGNTDSLAVDLTQDMGKVIVLDMGYNHLGLHLGMYKMVVESHDATQYQLRFAPLQDAGSGSILNVQRDRNTILSYASLLDGVEVFIEPERGTYDIVFTQYTVYFDDPGTQYLVTGAISAREGVRVAQFNNTDLASVELIDTLANPMSSAIDVIGYDWKEYDFDLSLFVTDPSIVFILQNAQEEYYKMRFTDFYGPTGQKGCPQFEVLPF